MRKGMLTVPTPNPHEANIGAGLLKQILRQAQITLPQWERL